MRLRFDSIEGCTNLIEIKKKMKIRSVIIFMDQIPLIFFSRFLKITTSSWSSKVHDYSANSFPRKVCHKDNYIRWVPPYGFSELCHLPRRILSRRITDLLTSGIILVAHGRQSPRRVGQIAWIFVSVVKLCSRISRKFPSFRLSSFLLYVSSET